MYQESTGEVLNMKSSGEHSLKRLPRIQRSLNALEEGRHSEFDIHACCDYIAWLAKWKKVPESVWNPMCEQATRILTEMR